MGNPDIETVETDQSTTDVTTTDVTTSTEEAAASEPETENEIGLKAWNITANGIEQVPATQEMVDRYLEQEEQEAVREAERGSAGSDILALFSDEAEEIVHAIEVEFKGHLQTFGIKQHSPKSAGRINARMERKNKGAITMRAKEDVDINGAAIALSESVMRNVGSDEKPAWVPVFTFADLAGEPEQRDNSGKKVLRPARLGLLDFPGQEAKNFANRLQAEVFAVNPELNPFLKGLAKQMMEQQITGLE